MVEVFPGLSRVTLSEAQKYGPVGSINCSLALEETRVLLAGQRGLSFSLR